MTSAKLKKYQGLLAKLAVIRQRETEILKEMDALWCTMSLKEVREHYRQAKAACVSQEKR